MTEKEKVKQGLLYNPNYDEELIKERLQAQELCYTYNRLASESIKGKKRNITKAI